MWCIFKLLIWNRYANTAQALDDRGGVTRFSIPLHTTEDLSCCLIWSFFVSSKPKEMWVKYGLCSFWIHQVCIEGLKHLIVNLIEKIHT